MAKTGTNIGAGKGRFKSGADARRGTGKAGRSGRKPLAFKLECERLADEVVLPKVAAYLAAHTLNDQPSRESSVNPTWQWCADYVTAYGKGKPTQPIEHSFNHEDALTELE